MPSLARGTHDRRSLPGARADEEPTASLPAPLDAGLSARQVANRLGSGRSIVSSTVRGSERFCDRCVQRRNRLWVHHRWRERRVRTDGGGQTACRRKRRAGDGRRAYGRRGDGQWGARAEVGGVGVQRWAVDQPTCALCGGHSLADPTDPQDDGTEWTSRPYEHVSRLQTVARDCPWSHHAGNR